MEKFQGPEHPKNLSLKFIIICHMDWRWTYGVVFEAKEKSCVVFSTMAPSGCLLKHPPTHSVAIDGYRSDWFSLSIRWGASWKLLPTNHCTQSIPSISCSCQSKSLIQLSLWGVASSPQKQLLSKLCSHLSISSSQAPAVHHLSIFAKDLI